MIRSILVLAAGLLLAGCALLAPPPAPTTLTDRLAALPAAGLALARPVTIHWNDHQVPFIEAETDRDLALALGVVHAHLRLGQMEILRRIAQGRVAELGGPLATDIDHGLRILDFPRAAAATVAAMPAATRAWVEAYVEGINHVLDTAPAPPHEFRVLGLAREPWRPEDLVAIGRLAGTDVNWLVWFTLLRLRDRPDWPAIWERVIREGEASIPSFRAPSQFALADVLAGVARSGSNSLVVARHRTTHGAALMANDPHLGLSLPNTWLIVGMRSPSYNAVGLMVPGLPFVAVGRNATIAWGGTNMRAYASELYDVSRLDPATIRERPIRIGVRWWFDRETVVRETPLGPILTDAPILKDWKGAPLALRWTGHIPSDEISAMLAVNRARNFEEFRSALKGFSVPGQNFLYADVAGNIGQVLGVRLPRRPAAPPADFIRDGANGDDGWNDLVDAHALPSIENPAEGYIASANNRPTDSAVPVGWFFSPNDRMERMNALLERGRLDVEALKRVQLDVAMPSAVATRDRVLARLGPARGDANEAERLVRGWDGRYETASRGALAFELFLHHFRAAFYAGDPAPELFDTNGMLGADVEAAPAERVRAAAETAFAAAQGDLTRFADWGEMHRLGLQHPLGFLPLIGGRYRFGDHPVAGSSNTLMKTAHGPTNERHTARYGTNARHISDLADPDRNWFVLMGGQDGWLNSAGFLDQVPLFLRGEYVTVPLRVETARRAFPHKTRLAPRAPQ